jgi:hypothetical protein
MNWQGGDTLAEEQVTVAAQEKVLDDPAQTPRLIGFQVVLIEYH